VKLWTGDSVLELLDMIFSGGWIETQNTSFSPSCNLRGQIFSNIANRTNKFNENSFDNAQDKERAKRVWLNPFDGQALA
jgi:hypothetical protein